MHVKGQYDPTIDIAFKKLFGVERNKELLISLINSILEQKDSVKDLVLINPYNEREFKEDKLSILDIKAQDKNGKRFNIEMQVTDVNDYDKRALYYWAKTYIQQLKEREKYSELSKTIGIHFLNFACIKNTREYHNIFRLREVKNNNIYTKMFEDMEIHTLELGKFESENQQEEVDMESLKDSINLWMTFLTKRRLLSDIDLKKIPEGQVIKKAIRELEYMVMSEKEREMYDDHQKFLRDEASAIDAAIKKEKAKRSIAEKQAQEAEKQAQEAEKQAQAEKQRADKLAMKLEQLLRASAASQITDSGEKVRKDPKEKDIKNS